VKILYFAEGKNDLNIRLMDENSKKINKVDIGLKI
jgi:hypothetical protein